MGLLDDDLILHAREIGDLVDLLAVRAGDNSGGAQRQRGCRAGCDHGRFRADQGRDALAHRVMQFFHFDKILRRVVDRFHHFGPHQRPAMGGVSAGGIDKGADLQFAQQIALGSRRLRRRWAAE
jgi:hypothetical protein